MKTFILNIEEDSEPQNNPPDLPDLPDSFASPDADSPLIDIQ